MWCGPGEHEFVFCIPPFPRTRLQLLLITGFLSASIILFLFLMCFMCSIHCTDTIVSYYLRGLGFVFFSFLFLFFSIFISENLHLVSSVFIFECFFETEFVKVAQDSFELRTVFLQHSQVLSLLV